MGRALAVPIMCSPRNRTERQVVEDNRGDGTVDLFAVVDVVSYATRGNALGDRSMVHRLIRMELPTMVLMSAPFQVVGSSLHQHIR